MNGSNWLFHRLFLPFLCLFWGGTKGSQEGLLASYVSINEGVALRLERVDCSNEETRTTDESPSLSVSSGSPFPFLTSSPSPSPRLPLTCDSIMNKLKLRVFTEREVTLDPHVFPVNRKNLAGLIAYNYIKSAYYDLLSDKILIKSCLNLNVLYDLMTIHFEIAEFIGYQLCLEVILKLVIDYFKEKIDFNPKLTNNSKWSIKVARNITDFLEFVLMYLTPRYQFICGDPSYRLADACDVDLTSFVLLDSILEVSVIVRFREPEMLQAVLDRYKQVWAATSTEEYLDSALKIIPNESFHRLTGASHFLREFVVILVKEVPEFFISPRFADYFGRRQVQSDSKFAVAFIYMSPIFRALLLADSKASISDYLLLYHQKMFPAHNLTDPSARRFSICGAPLAVLNIYIIESNFMLTTSEDQFLLKQQLLKLILKFFFGFSSGRDNFYNFALHCLKQRHLPLYEALLKYLSPNMWLSFREKISLINCGVVNPAYFVSPLLVTVLNMAYLDFENYDMMFNEFRGTMFPADRSQVLKEIIWLLQDFPIKEAHNSILFEADEQQEEVDDTEHEGFHNVYWPCPKFLGDSNLLEYEKYPYLFHYAQVILYRKFGISISVISGFENYFGESCCWVEMIGFMNLIIERFAQFMGIDAYDGKKLIRFSHSLKAEPEVSVSVEAVGEDSDDADGFDSLFGKIDFI